MTSIDTSEFVQAPEGQESLKFSDERQQAHFELGVTMALHKWEELTTAVDNSWGGPNSSDKRDWLSATVIDLFEEKIVDIQLIEETLLYGMLDEFDTQVDNDSALEIAYLIFKFYQKAAINDFNDIDELYNKWQIKQQNRQKNLVNIQLDPNNPSSDEDEEEEDQDMDVEMDVEPTIEESTGPVVDDDGFTLVQSKKGNRRR